VTPDSTYFDALDATWPAARSFRAGPWLIREGQGGGQRVSAATAAMRWTPDDIPQAEAEMRRLGQTPLFMLHGKEIRLDAVLDARGFARRDETRLYAGQVAELARPGQGVTTHWPPVPGQISLWKAGGIGPERIAVMHRAAAPKASFAAFFGGRIIGAGFAAISGRLAMLHALDVAPSHRRHGIATHMLAGISRWAQDMGAAEICLAVTKENFAANALYVNNAMSVVTAYHYRIGHQEPG